MALPAVRSLAALGSVTVAGPAFIAELYRGLSLNMSKWHTRLPGAGFDVAVLLKPSLRAAWSVRGVPRRVGLDLNHRGPLLTDRVAPTGGHRVDDLSAVALEAGAAPDGLPTFSVTPDEVAWAAGLALHPRAVLLLPGTRSGATVRWPQFRALADRLGDRAVFAGGPGDEAVLAEVAGPHRVLPPPTLGQLGALAGRVAAVVGNDSGLPHLVAAALRASGAPVERLHVVFGSTDPARTGPVGATAWPGPRPPCWPCYAKRCGIGLPCLDVDPDAVAAALA